MTELLLDTHAWAWTLVADPRLSVAARAAIQGASAVHVSPISFFEIAQKIRVGKWPEMVPHVDRLPELLKLQGGHVAALTPTIAARAGSMEWSHRDTFDRFLAASAQHLGLPLVSADDVFDSVGVVRVW